MGQIEEQSKDWKSFRRKPADYIDKKSFEGFGIELAILKRTCLLKRGRYYKRGIDLLGMEYYDQRLSRAQQALSTLLSESVTQFQAGLFEMLPSGGPVRTQIVGAETVK